MNFVIGANFRGANKGCGYWQQITVSVCVCVCGGGYLGLFVG